jgi:hypothetical protein
MIGNRLASRIVSAARQAEAVLVALVLSAVIAAAQGHPDLTGTWMLDPARSDPPASGAGVAPAGGGFGRGGGAVPANQMVIRQTDSELVVTSGNVNVYYNVDGSERSGPPGGETKSKIAWDGGKLVVTWRREYFAGPDRGYLTSTGRDVYTIEGNTLTVERTSTAPQQPTQTRKSVYTKVS